MLNALISFIGGNAFRTIFGEISAYFTAKQQHAQEMDRMKLQGQLDAAASDRLQAGVKQQAELGVKTIQVQGDIEIQKIEADGWLEAVKATTRTVGIPFIDAWNAAIRPGVATWAVFMLTGASFSAVVLTDFMISVCSSAIGIFIADRNLAKRGK